MKNRDDILKDIGRREGRRDIFVEKWLSENVKPGKKPTVKNIVEAMVRYIAFENGRAINR